MRLCRSSPWSWKHASRSRDNSPGHAHSPSSPLRPRAFLIENGTAVVALATIFIFTATRRTGIEHDGVNSVAITTLSPFVSLYGSLLLALSLCRFHFRLNGSFGAGVRRNAFGLSAPSPFLCLSRSQRSLLILSPTLYTQCWLRSSFSLSSSVSSDCVTLR